MNSMEPRSPSPATAEGNNTTRSPRIRTVSLGGSKPSPPGRKRKSASLPSETVEYLKNWIMSPEHIAHPYPTEQEKAQIMEDTGIEMKQLTNWFVNNRKRYWKPRVEAKLRQQQKTVAVVVSKKPTATTVPEEEDEEQTPQQEQPVVSMRPVVTTQQPAVVSPGRAVISAQSSVASETGYLTNSDSLEDLFAAGQATEEAITKTETISVHILRSSLMRPTLQDVSVLSHIPRERIVRTFDDCILSYKCTALEAADTKKVSVL